MFAYRPKRNIGCNFCLQGRVVAIPQVSQGFFCVSNGLKECEPKATGLSSLPSLTAKLREFLPLAQPFRAASETRRSAPHYQDADFLSNLAAQHI
jgi:hypothetical protein